MCQNVGGFGWWSVGLIVVNCHVVFAEALVEFEDWCRIFDPPRRWCPRLLDDGGRSGRGGCDSLEGVRTRRYEIERSRMVNTHAQQVHLVLVHLLVYRG